MQLHLQSSLRRTLTSVLPSKILLSIIGVLLLINAVSIGLCTNGFEAVLRAAAPAEQLHSFLVRNHVTFKKHFVMKDCLYEMTLRQVHVDMLHKDYVQLHLQKSFITFLSGWQTAEKGLFLGIKASSDSNLNCEFSIKTITCHLALKSNVCQNYLHNLRKPSGLKVKYCSKFKWM